MIYGTDTSVYKSNKDKELLENISSGTAITNLSGIEDLPLVRRDEVIASGAELLNQYKYEPRLVSTSVGLVMKPPLFIKPTLFISNYRLILIGTYTQEHWAHDWIGEIQEARRRGKFGVVAASVWHKIDARSHLYQYPNVFKKDKKVRLDVITAEVMHYYTNKWYDYTNRIDHNLCVKVGTGKTETILGCHLFFKKGFDAGPLCDTLEGIVESAKPLTLEEIAQYHHNIATAGRKGLFMVKGFLG